MSKLPNLIQILSDEHCGFAMSCAGDSNVRTPNLDRMAAEGMRFEQAYANCPVCTPSRGTIFSGRHAHAGPVPGFFDTWKVGAPSTATVLGEAGYHTAYFGKWHCGIVNDQVPAMVGKDPSRYPGKPNRTPEDRRAGFADWAGFEVINAPFKSYIYRNHEREPIRLEGYQTDALTDLVIDYIREYDRPEPLYLVLSIEPPHFPLEVPDRFKRFDQGALNLRPNCDDTAERREHVANYYAMIENLDWNIGRLLSAMEKLPAFRGDQTCVSYISDHGELMGSHGLFCRKEYPYEEAVRIPAIFHWPGHIPPRGTIPGLFSLVDYAPTITALGGVTPPRWMQGFDWSPALKGGDVTGPSEVLLEMTESPMWTPAYLNWRGFTDGRWKYAFYEDRHEELFDLQSDPFEQTNLALSAPEECRNMRRRLLDLLAATREPFFDVIMEHGVEPPQEVYHLPPTYSDMGFPSDWTGKKGIPSS
jgi:arylsulfatase A-like enzyme